VSALAQRRRTLAMHASRVAVMLGVAVVSEHPSFPADPNFRAIFASGSKRPVRASDGVPLALWLEVRLELGVWEIVAVDGESYRCVVVSWRTTTLLGLALDAWDQGRHAERAIRDKRRG
jgi:hypothetical protein